MPIAATQGECPRNQPLAKCAIRNYSGFRTLLVKLPIRNVLIRRSGGPVRDRQPVPALKPTTTIHRRWTRPGTAGHCRDTYETAETTLTRPAAATARGWSHTTSGTPGTRRSGRRRDPRARWRARVAEEAL